ncbi:ead/Ea22-like family protein [Kluyvera ascorbata]|uniref:ead/Ea22-like family protein n=1 Tax=Kluyvera ascorbata TaxID=51288 RepID=UPI002DBDAFA2|nr:ead/Ea22-like family protein [Kluyvera ascorbata]MEB6390640.1 ead/Ea22-like family protein [Kluyvera ascorbata]
MNDITVLAQRIKAAAAIAKSSDDWGYGSDNFHDAATPDNVLALVEALEKAQQYAKARDEENQSLMLTVGRLRVERESMESRTVTVKLPLPRRKTADDYVDDTFEPCDLAAIYNACRLECEVKFKNALAAAGIQVIEGEA